MSCAPRLSDLSRVLAVGSCALVLVLSACGGDDTSDEKSAGSSTSEAGSSASDTGNGDSGSGEGASNPCATVTEEQFVAIFGSEVTMGEAAGSSKNCSIIATGDSSGATISFQNLTDSGLATSYDESVANMGPCSGEPEEVSGVGDRAAVDVSCFGKAGNAQLIAEVDGEVVGFYVSSGEPAGADPGTVKDTLIEIASQSFGGG